MKCTYIDGDLVIDSGAICSMRKDWNFFVELDESFREIDKNANRTESNVLRKNLVYCEILKEI